MKILKDLCKRITEKQGANKGAASPPFGVSWMDSWVAHWVYNENLQATEAHDKELTIVLKSLVDLKFNERLNEIRRFIREYPRLAPDGGPPEPGSPPSGPATFAPPDAGPPEPGAPSPAGPVAFPELASEPGVPPAGPSGPEPEPPDGGTPEPGVPPTGPDAGFMSENPWILYWFISIKAPLLLDVIDAHMTRRMNDLRGRTAAE